MADENLQLSMDELFKIVGELFIKNHLLTKNLQSLTDKKEVKNGEKD